ncbi:mRNA decay protein, partial [Coemansia aciculifera]
MFGADDASEQVVSMESCKRIKGVLRDYLDSAVSHLETMHHGLVRMRRSADEKLFSKGAVHAETKERIEKHAKSFDRLRENVTMLCEALGRTPPHFDDSIDDENQLGIVFDGPGDANSASLGRQYKQWEDEEERSLYETILDLQSLLPPSMLAIRRKKPKGAADGGKEQQSSAALDAEGVDQASTGEAASSGDAVDIDDINEDDIKVDLQPEAGDVDDADDDNGDASNALGLLEYQKYMSQRRGGANLPDEQAPKPERLGHTATSETSVGKDEALSSADRTKSLEPADSDASKTAPEEAAAGGEGTMTIVQQSGPARTVTQTVAPMSFASILRCLPALTTKEGADQAALNFCYVNSKVNRAALIRALVEVPRRQQFLIPFYARFIAVLHPFFPEIGDSVLEELNHEFRWLSKQRFKDLMETRLKNIKYIAELTKFKVAPLHVSFRCAKATLE